MRSNVEHASRLHRPRVLHFGLSSRPVHQQPTNNNQNDDPPVPVIIDACVQAEGVTTTPRDVRVVPPCTTPVQRKRARTARGEPSLPYNAESGDEDGCRPISSSPPTTPPNRYFEGFNKW